jgi:hypothetical protein
MMMMTMIKKSFIFLVAETYLIEDGENFSPKKKLLIPSRVASFRQLHPPSLLLVSRDKATRERKNVHFVSPEKDKKNVDTRK